MVTFSAIEINYKKVYNYNNDFGKIIKIFCRNSIVHTFHAAYAEYLNKVSAFLNLELV